MTVSNTRVAFRTAHPGDAEAVAHLHTESWKRTYRGMMTDEFLDGGALENRLRVWHERLRTPRANQYVCIAEEGPTLIGFICAFAAEDPVWGSYIDNLHVVSSSHRRGVGRVLMHHAAEWLARAEPDRGVFLWVMEANTPARAFYERLGATNAGTTDLVDPGGGHAPNCRYIWANPHMLLGV